MPTCGCCRLHTYPRCGAFDLDKAAAQIPLLTQCAHLSLAHYLRAVRDAGHRVAPATRQAIRSNMALCAQEVAHPPPIADTVREFMPVRQADLDALSREPGCAGPLTWQQGRGRRRWRRGGGGAAVARSS